MSVRENFADIYLRHFFFGNFNPIRCLRVARKPVEPMLWSTIAKRTITKNRFVSVRSHGTPRTESDKHCDQNKENV